MSAPSEFHPRDVLGVITAIGAVTSVGRSAASSCAAIRAGISRPRRVSHFQVLDPETQDTLPLTAHPVQGYTDGFVGMGRWLRLARGCLREVLETPGLPRPSDARFWSSTALMMVAPSRDDGVFEVEGDDGLDGIREYCLRPLRDALGLSLPDANVRVVDQGPAGAAAAVQQASGELWRAGFERILVLAVDSLLDPEALRVLDEEGRLKVGDNPVGLMPGEAGACFLLEQEGGARQRGAAPLALVTGVATAQERLHLYAGHVSQGDGLAACIREVLARGSRPARFEGDLYSDLNGEEWRAREWGTALIRLGEELDAPNVHLPGVSVGDVGAASGALGVCQAVHAFVRGHSRTRQALVVSSSPWGTVGCLRLHSAGT
ncbi:hypothetical protein QEG98_40575 [Myxococcus sp. MxC21-1]|uniref:hypothetical protein n=1 Tax=Myxococcus sp. MxC21-1 TaxID=3041439 RepID=UPI00292D755B|nr:hypothetical protein [Myxococcus sp. MxC21-1]WNZ62051.1 hypothetical protein QEG98_40575 [Myxococcus sp. MxC21-1]